MLQRSASRYAAETALSQDPYPERWLAVTAALFGLSALAYGVSVLRAHARPEP